MKKVLASSFVGFCLAVLVMGTAGSTEMGESATMGEITKVSVINLASPPPVTEKRLFKEVIASSNCGEKCTSDSSCRFTSGNECQHCNSTTKTCGH